MLPFIILNINIAGLTTLIGHPPNLLITGNAFVAQHHVTFLTYSMHMCIGVVIALIQTNIHLRIQCRNIRKLMNVNPNENDELEVWRKCYQNIDTSKSNALNGLKIIMKQKIDSLEHDNSIKMNANDVKSFQSTLEYLKKMVSLDQLKNQQLLIFHVNLTKFGDCFSIRSKTCRC